MLIAAALLILISTIVACQPSKSTPQPNKLQLVDAQKACKPENDDARIEKCNDDMNLNELCQRCEKISESKGGDVFALCCSNIENATRFCRDYVYYGERTNST